MTIEFHCLGCRYLFRVADSFAGKKGRCPTCGAISDIPVVLTAAAPPPLPIEQPLDVIPVTEPLDVVPVDEASSEPLRPRDAFDDGPHPHRGGKRKRSRKGLIIGLSVGGGVLLLVGVLLLIFLNRGGLGDDLKYLPNNCNVVVSFKAADFVDSTWGRNFRINPANPGGGAVDDQFKRSTGFATRDVERVVMGSDGDATVYIVHLRKGINAADARSALTTGPFQGKMFTESKVGRYGMFATGDEDNGPAFCLVNSTTLVFSPRANALEAILKRDKKAEVTTAFQNALDKADFSRTLCIAADLKVLNANPGPGNPMARLALPFGVGMPIDMLGLARAFVMEPGLPSQSLEGYVAHVHTSASELTVGCIMIFKDSTAAEEIRSKISDRIDSSRMKPGLVSGFAQMRVSREGAAVRLTFTVRQTNFDGFKIF